ncbi:hypothetical protein, partial [Salmonella enterica]|uniref:hypothetical protein n=1 Tax=Salmonella enterica TaxID=28901 RepID=UPI0020C408E6
LDFTRKVYNDLQKKLKKNNSDIANMQQMLNDAIARLEAKSEEAAYLTKEVNTLHAAANILSTPQEGREKLRLNTPQA